jgi:hypothetical protein
MAAAIIVSINNSATPSHPSITKHEALPCPKPRTARLRCNKAIGGDWEFPVLSYQIRLRALFVNESKPVG